MNVNELIILGFVFLFVWSVTFSLIYRAVTHSRKTRERLKSSDEDDPATERLQMVLGEMTPGLAEQVPMTLKARLELQKELMAAGFYRLTAITEYAAIRTILVVAPLILSGVLAL